MKKILMVAFFGLFSFGASNFENATKEYIVVKNTENAFELFKKSCQEDKSAEGCYIAGYFIDMGYGDHQDMKSSKLYKTACDLGSMDGCQKMGELYDNGTGGIEQDYKKAMEFFTKACDAKMASACYFVGTYYDSGLGVEKDYKKALEYYQQACDGKYGDACYNVADMHEVGDGVEKSIEKATEFYGLACDYGISDGCAKFRALSKKK